MLTKKYNLINSPTIAVWEYNTNTQEVIWSAGFYAILGYQPGEIECSYRFFFDHLLYHDDRKRLLYHPSPVQIRLLTKLHGYQWFENTFQKNDDKTTPKLYGTLINIHRYKQIELKTAQTELAYNYAIQLAKIHSWQINVANMEIMLPAETYELLEVRGNKKITFDEFVSFFEHAYKSAIINAIDNAVRLSNPFDLQAAIITAKNKVINVNFKGIPVIDAYGKVQNIRGIFRRVTHEHVLQQKTITLLEDQNNRLKNFAYMVSHNLRTHTGNLDSMIELYEKAESATEAEELFSHIKTVSNSLGKTINELNEIVKIQVETISEKKTVNFELLFKNTIAALEPTITETATRIEYDFTSCAQIEYIPAYLESIFQNLLTNALKYSYPGRPLVINCHTYLENNHAYLVFEDNGIGIDLDKYGKDVFGLYKTFHQNSNSKGVGLFITRNQVEALGGSITIKSEVNTGTTFIIRLT
ncbi:MAG TPA: PAS domain-containing sensor histidine kinase [Mucilaginibacter sp.]